MLVFAISCLLLAVTALGQEGDTGKTAVIRNAVLEGEMAVTRVFRASNEDRNITYDPNCDPYWKNMSPEHTMCMVDKGTDVVLDQATKDALVEQHNQLRAGVDPLAANMAKVIWDDELAMVAAKWARQCVVGHDTYNRVPSLPGISVGQNGAFGYSTFAGGVQGWYNEVRDFQYGVGSFNGGVVGHYTQVVNAATQRIGCGQADCPGFPYGKYYFCNYAYGQYGTKTPYSNATVSCESCPDKCDASGKLCDCGGKLCFNGGNLDINTCQCNCQTPLYSGDVCETLNCPAGDAWVCGPGNQWPPSFCSKYSNVKYKCPYMCDICAHECGEKQCMNGGTMDYQTCQCTCRSDFEGDTCETAVCGGKRCQNGGTLDKSTCTCRCPSLYTGDTCETKNCPLKDTWVCGPGNQWPPSFCTKYSNVPGKCPYMCGLCEHQCGTKQCYNGGTMNYQTCTCTCKGDWTGDECLDVVCGGKKCKNGGSLDRSTCNCRCTHSFYSGDTCEIKNCPTSDPFYCVSQWPPSYCTAYAHYVPQRCPYMCNLCQ